jgi:hypothetical protein
VYEVKDGENIVTVYVIPRELKNDVNIGQSVFPDVNLEAHKYSEVFLGLVITKKVGPVFYVNAAPLQLVFGSDGSVECMRDTEKKKTSEGEIAGRVEKLQVCHYWNCLVLTVLYNSH